VVGDAAATGAGAVSTTTSFMSAVSGRRIVFNHPAHLRLVNDISAGRAPGISIAPELQHLLATLGSVGTVVVMSLFRRGQGPHGVIQPDGSVVCRGVDITGFAGAPVTLSNPNAAIAVVTNLIANFPAGKYDLGFPRPVGGDNNFDASQDVFFPVPDAATVHQAFIGRAGRPMSAMLQPARFLPTTNDAGPPPGHTDSGWNGACARRWGASADGVLAEIARHCSANSCVTKSVVSDAVVESADTYRRDALLIPPLRLDKAEP
jgi:hypothetical protein